MRVIGICAVLLAAVVAIVYFDQTTWATPLVAAILVGTVGNAFVQFACARDEELTPQGQRIAGYVRGVLLVITLLIAGAIVWLWAVRAYGEFLLR
jgi:hypothetical protein